MEAVYGGSGPPDGLSGRGQGPVLLLGHSYLWDSANGAPANRGPQGQYRCIVPGALGPRGFRCHLPGRPLHPGDPGPGSSGLARRPRHSTTSCWNGPPSVACGAMELARMAPARIKGLVLMDSFVGLEPQITCQSATSPCWRHRAGRDHTQPIIEQVAPLFFAHQPDAALMAV